MAKKVSKKVKRRLVIFGTLSVVAIGYFLVTLISYVYNYASLIAEEKNLQTNLASLKQEKVDLKTEIDKLNDPEYIARYAKEKYLYSVDGEFVIKLDDKEDDSQENSVSDNKDLYAIIIGSGAFLVVFTLIIRAKIRR